MPLMFSSAGFKERKFPFVFKESKDKFTDVPASNQRFV
jgi:hypothetical protein